MTVSTTRNRSPETTVGSACAVTEGELLTKIATMMRSQSKPTEWTDAEQERQYDLSPLVLEARSNGRASSAFFVDPWEVVGDAADADLKRIKAEQSAAARVK